MGGQGAVATPTFQPPDAPGSLAGTAGGHLASWGMETAEPEGESFRMGCGGGGGGDLQLPPKASRDFHQESRALSQRALGMVFTCDVPHGSKRCRRPGPSGISVSCKGRQAPTWVQAYIHMSPSLTSRLAEIHPPKEKPTPRGSGGKKELEGSD